MKSEKEKRGTPPRKDSGTRRWGLVPDEEDPRRQLWEWRPGEPDDLDALFNRIANQTASDDDHDLFDASIIDRFINRVFAGEQVEPWIMSHLAESFYKVLMGSDWNDEVLLPGRPVSPIRPWRDQRDLEIYCDASNAINLSGMKVTEAISHAATKHAVSFETARAGYYRWRDQLSKKTENT